MPLAIVVAACCSSLAARFSLPAAASVTACSAWLEIDWPIPGSTEPEATPEATSLTTAASAAGPLGSVVVVVEVVVVVVLLEVAGGRDVEVVESMAPGGPLGLDLRPRIS